MSKKKLFAAIVALAAVAFGVFQAYLYSIAYYARAPVYQSGDGALNGYDAVSYFQAGGPVRGKPEFSAEWDGATWYFASAENQATFKHRPESFAPQFGGYCAYAVGNGYTAKSDPLAWHVENGRLYLNFDAGVREKWLAQRTELIAAAERNWPAVIRD